MTARRHRAAGFTLFEVLVVMLIIGLLVTFAVLGIDFSSRQEQQKQEAQRLIHLLRLASDEALLQSRQFGIRFKEREYQFYELLNGVSWKSVSGDSQLRQRELPEQFKFEIRIEGVSISLDKEERDADGQLVVKPQIFLLSSGELLPDFAILIQDRDSSRQYHISPGEEQPLKLSVEGGFDGY